MTSGRILSGCVLGVWIAAGCAVAGTFPSGIAREALAESESLDRLSVGADYELMRRDVRYGSAGEKTSIESEFVGGFLGLDLVSWLTLFGTAGAASVKDDVSGVDGDWIFSWSVGLGAHFWKYELREPSWMAGVLSIRGVAEYARRSSENVGWSLDTVEWSEVSIALPVCYEMFEDLSPLVDRSLQKSLNLYAGPALSLWDGRRKGAWGTEDSEAEKEFGVIAGADVFLARNLSVGGHVLVLDDVSARGSLRYHF